MECRVVKWFYGIFCLQCTLKEKDSNYSGQHTFVGGNKNRLKHYCRKDYHAWETVHHLKRKGAILIANSYFSKLILSLQCLQYTTDTKPACGLETTLKHFMMKWKSQQQEAIKRKADRRQQQENFLKGPSNAQRSGKWPGRTREWVH